MIDSITYLGIGFLVAALVIGGLSVFVVVPFVHGRAVRLTTRRLEVVMPLSIPEIKAEKDVLRDELDTSTQRLETNAEPLKTKSASQLVELGKKGDAINRLKIYLDALRDQLHATKEQLAVKVTAMGEAERALSEKESELAKLTSALNERSALSDLQKTEIVALGMQVQTLQGRLTQACEESKALEDRRNAAVRALSDKDSELAKLTSVLNERTALADLQKAEIVALTMQVQTLNDRLKQAGEEVRAVKEHRSAAVREAERALSGKESELAKLTSTLDSQKTEIVALTLQVQTLNERLDQACEEARAVEERGSAAACEAERALSDKESELAKLTSALEERSALADSRKAEIAVLTMQVQALNERLTEADEETRAVEGRRDATMRALSERECELAKLTNTLDERSVLADSRKAEIAALTIQVQTLSDRLTQAAGETKVAEDRRDAVSRALSEKEFDLARLTSALEERSVLAESQKAENEALTTHVQMLNERLTDAGEEARTVREHCNAALRALSKKESELAILTSALEQRSALVDSQEVENAALRTQVRTLNERLVQAGKEARAVEERRDVERSELKAANQKLKAATQNLVEERTNFENFHHHVVKLVQQLTAQRTEDKALDRRAREDLENRLIEQSRMLDESERELTHLRGEVEIASKAEDELRVAVIKIEGRASAATQKFIDEKTQLQAELDRAKSERARLMHELADLKRRQAHESRTAERVDNGAARECVNDIDAERARRAAYGRLPRRANS